MAALAFDICGEHDRSELVFDAFRGKLVCGPCRVSKNRKKIIAAEVKLSEANRAIEILVPGPQPLAADASRSAPLWTKPRVIEVDQRSTEDALNISPLWPNGEPRSAGFCKRRTCLFVRMQFDREYGILVCHQCEYFELPGEIASKDMRVIYAKDQHLPQGLRMERCPRCTFSMKLDERLGLHVCPGCEYFQVAEAEHFQFTLKRIEAYVGKSRGETDSNVDGGRTIAL